MAVIGYARVSTSEQSLDLQLDSLRLAGASEIYEEKASGKSANRPELEHCLKALRPGDELVVWRLDRLGRNLKDLIRIVEDLKDKGVSFRSITERIDTSGPTSTLVFHLFASLAQFERSLILERTQAGMEAARARGRKGGRPPALDAEKARMAKAMMKNREFSVASLARQFGVSRTTLYELASQDKKQPYS
ncbi:DNA invertase Pin-like site-specific DNA recombinase [Herbaspirillum sp. 1173]|uniref:recombinase family protein n=1 Tax=Herbaspirillum sp. 1173 TaxID=2817734 RepID=UPI00285B918D|nr:recombinase family protein [Herbaspirillum sp. 1173]MDR6739124.1 DNA invertase Pin-like site-specific DNA recombinase [Herbaspirillum sp. 1173]